MNSQERKNTPVFSGVMQYFPDALMAVAQHSKAGNDKHNPGQPLHWSRGKSKDHADCVARHLIDIGPNWDLKDPETGSFHATALAWRALALLQLVIEADHAKVQKFLDDNKDLMQDLQKVEKAAGEPYVAKQEDLSVSDQMTDSERKEKWLAP